MLKTIYHALIGQENQISKVVDKLDGVVVDSGTSKLYYYSNKDGGTNRISNSDVLLGIFGEVEYGGKADMLTADKCNGFVIDFFRNVLANRESKHVMVNCDKTMAMYINILKELFNIEVEYISITYLKNAHLKLNLNKLNSITDIMQLKHFKNNIKRYSKVVFVDTDGIGGNSLDITNKLFSDVKACYVGVGVSNSRCRHAAAFYNTLLQNMGVDGIVDRLMYIDVNTYDIAVQELVDNVIYLLAIYASECKKKVLVVSKDMYYTHINKIVGKDIITKYYTYITMLLHKKSIYSNDKNSLVSIQNKLIRTYTKGERKKVIKDFNLWGFDGEAIVNSLEALQDSLNLLGFGM